MTSRTTARFRRAYAALPAHVRQQARDAYRTFARDPSHPSLRLKPVHPRRPIYSARVGLGYRAVAARGAGGWVWFWIGSHADYDRLLATLEASGRVLSPTERRWPAVNSLMALAGSGWCRC